MKSVFSLGDVASLVPDARSRLMAIMEASYQAADAEAPETPVHLMIRGFVARQQVRELLRENIVRDPERRTAMAALTVVSSGLRGFKRRLTLDQCNSLLRSGLGDGGVDVGNSAARVEIAVDQLVNGWPPAEEMPLRPNEDGLIVYNPERWERWMQHISANRPDHNDPRAPPTSGIQPPDQGELHPWALAGYLSVSLSDGTAVKARSRNNPAVLEVLALVMLSMPRNRGIRDEILDLLANGVAIVTSGGHVSPRRLRELSLLIRRETDCSDIHLCKSVVEKGWDVLSRFWKGTETGEDFKVMFEQLGKTTGTIAPTLQTMCAETEFKMLTGITTVARSIHRSDTTHAEKRNELRWTVTRR